MSEEAAFLETLKANPADDTARLVYADWLDEHGEPARAEYLRLVAVLAQAEQDYAREQPEVARLLALGQTLPQEWRQEVGSRFMLVYYSHGDASRKLSAIKLIRETTGFGLAEAKTLAERPPSKLRECVLFEDALAARKRFEQIPGSVTRIHPTEMAVTQLPLSVVYAIVATRTVWGDRPGREAATAESIAAFARLLWRAMGGTAETAQTLAAKERVTIAENLDGLTAHHRVEELRRYLPLYDHTNGWAIYVSTQVTGVEPVAN